jgi:hypothetical protein
MLYCSIQQGRQPLLLDMNPGSVDCFVKLKDAWKGNYVETFEYGK